MGDIPGKEDALPWKETSRVDQRKEFIDAVLAEEGSMRELCQRFGKVSAGIEREGALIRAPGHCGRKGGAMGEIDQNSKP